ncbi:MAG: phosphotransferase [Parcubacteria group bacterium]|nr:phosphotransferase [Parcubacteria group bacterium]
MKNLSLEIIKFLNKANLAGYDVSPLAGDASDRRYYRLRHGKHSLILMDSSSAIETMRKFLSVREYLSDNKFSVPQVFHVDLNNGYMILEDFGDNTLDEYLTQNPKDSEQIYSFAVDLLTSLSTRTAPHLPEFNKQFFLHELSVFTAWYMPFIGKPLEDEELVEFNACWSQYFEYLSISDMMHVFVHKDMHCGNLFWLAERPGTRNLGMIDFQSAKKGSSVYDLTSLFYDCRFPLPQDLRKELLNKYISNTGWDIQNFKNICDIYIAQRNIKILGNFAHICQQKENATYLKFLPNAWKFIRQALENPILKDLKTWFTRNNIQPIEKVP